MPNNVKAAAWFLLIALLVASLAKPGFAAIDSADVCADKASVSTACTSARVTKLHESSAVFRREAQAPFPPGFDAAQLAEAKKYQQWLLDSAQKMDRLAAEGSRAMDPPASKGGRTGVGGSTSMSGSTSAGGGTALGSSAVATGSGTNGGLMQATQGMQEMQMSFNLQYLQLQNEMQNENRSFTMVSNIMKTKHDTVKNSISNLK